jgi:hypothetical protein
VIGHLTPLHRVHRVAEHVVHENLQLETTHQGRAELTVARENEIALSHRKSCAENGRLFAERAHVKADSPLTL